MIVTDPDNLDRFQICIDPIAETISIRGLGTQRHAVDQTGDSDGSTTFTDAGANFTSDGVTVGDILTIISDPANNGGIIGHYRVTSGIGTTTLVVDRAIPASTAADLTYKINAPQTPGSTSVQQVCDGVDMQTLFSFLKEEWITLAGSLGNAVDLNRFDFPFQAISSAAGQYIMGGVNGDAASAWKFATTNGVLTTDTEGQTRELIRSGGWQERNTSDIVLREYANFTTLGSLDSDAQAYYQQGDSTGNPANFKLTGAVNQAILTFGPDTSAGNMAFAATTITRTGGDWTTEGYRLGDYIKIRSAEDSGNNGTFGPITAISSTVITIASASFTVNADDDTAIIQPDHRRYTKLFARKKKRSYTSAVHADAGIPTTGILPLINKFPLTHSNDPAITFDDGIVSGGDGTADGNIFQSTETHTTGSDGAIPAALSSSGTFTLTSAGSTFNSQADSIVILRPGDSVALTSGSYQGVYEIASIDSATVLTLYAEPGRTYPGSGSGITFTVRTGIRDTGGTNATLANVNGSTGTLTSASSTFNADNGLGDRTVQPNDIVEVFAGTNAVIGYYKVVSVDSATQLTLNTSDQVFGGQTNQSYRIWRPGMFLQRFQSTATDTAGSLGFNDANPDTITRGAGSFTSDGFTNGMAITITNPEDAGNAKTVIAATVAALTITLISEETLTANADDTTAVLTGDSGIVRTVNGVVYPFHWRLFTNGGTLSHAFQFLQHALRRSYDIDGSSSSRRGDITDLLMSYISPNGTTLDLFPDDLSTGELNNVTYRDISGDSRNNAFLVGITFDVNDNLINSTNKRLTAYFTTNPAGNFGSNNAVIVDNSSGVDMNFTTITADIQTTFDYTNNAQGGRTPNTDAGITVVAIGDNGATHVLVTATITRTNSITISIPNLLERNYSNT
jgi:hypothetical protein